jgi:hypothetical protein
MATTNSNAINYFSPAKWVVSKVAGEGTHTTIGGALAAASAGDTIVVMPGTYTENNTITISVNITAYDGDGLANVTIIGQFAVSTAITVFLSNLFLQTNSATILAVSGSVASIVNCTNCYFNVTNFTGINHSSSSASSSVNLYNCSGNTSSNGFGLHATSSAGVLSYFGCNFTNSLSTSAFSNNSAGTVSINNSSFTNSFQTSGTGGILFNNSEINTATFNRITLNAQSTGIHNCFNSSFISGSTSPININSGSTVLMSLCNITSSNTNAITGAGTLNYSGLSFSGTSSGINVTTQVGGLLQGGVFQAPSAGFIGEQIRSYNGSGTSLTTATAAQVTSINLTAGVWDISVIGQCNFTGASTQFIVGISTSSTSFVPNNGADNVATDATSTAINTSTLYVPAYRVITTASSTTYSLVEKATFTTGTATGFGRISATRVG